MSFLLYMKIQKVPLIILGVLSLVASRAVFLFINDPEGPNLLVVVGLAVIIFAVCAIAYIAIHHLMRSS